MTHGQSLRRRIAVAVARRGGAPLNALDFVVGLLSLTAVLAASVASPARGQQPTPLEGPAGVVYTANEHGSSISAINLATGQVDTVPLSISPHNVQITADGARLLVVGEAAAGGHGEAGHDGDEAPGLLLVFDTAQLTSRPVASIAVGAHPAHVVVDRDGRRAFVTDSDSNAVTVVDIARKTALQAIPTGRYPHGLRISPDGREAYVANVQDGTVSVLDIAALVEIARIPVGAAPVQVGFTPDGARVYVSLRDENRVAVVDTRRREVVARIAVGRNPIQLHATPDGRYVYVANQGTETEPDDTVSVIEVAIGRVIDTIRTGRGAHGVAVSADGSRVFVTNIADSTVSVIDAATREVVATYPVGRGPNGVTYRAGEG
jgi:YVTN family beta-propeller protein